MHSTNMCCNSLSTILASFLTVTRCRYNGKSKNLSTRNIYNISYSIEYKFTFIVCALFYSKIMVVMNECESGVNILTIHLTSLLWITSFHNE